MNHPDREILDRAVLLDLLQASKDRYLRLTFDMQAAVDALRMVPTLEMHRILDHYLTTGTFADEPLYLGLTA